MSPPMERESLAKSRRRVPALPADQENLNDTIKTIVSFSEVNNILPTAISDKLRERVNNDDGFYCWAIQRGGKQRIFEQMNDDIVIFKPNGQPSKEGNYQYFKYKGQVIFKTICPDLGRHLWSSGSNWDFIYFFQTIAKIKIKHHRLAKELHYKNDRPRILAGTIRVDPVKLHQYVPNENLNAFLDSIDENSENYFFCCHKVLGLQLVYVHSGGSGNARRRGAVPSDIVGTGLLLHVHQSSDLLSQQIIDHHRHMGLFRQIILNLRYRVKGIGKILI